MTDSGLTLDHFHSLCCWFLYHLWLANIFI